jgi:outer membrane receptor for monomeric catechols
MKSRNMIRVANRIENLVATTRAVKVGFNMGSYLNNGNQDFSGHECGTVACIAGHACLEAGYTPAQLKKTTSDKIRVDATNFLGLTYDEARQLFCPYRVMEQVADIRNLKNVSLKMAVATLRASASAKRITWVRPL